MRAHVIAIFRHMPVIIWSATVDVYAKLTVQDSSWRSLLYYLLLLRYHRLSCQAPSATLAPRRELWYVVFGSFMYVCHYTH